MRVIRSSLSSAEASNSCHVLFANSRNKESILEIILAADHTFHSSNFLEDITHCLFICPSK